MKLNIRQLKGRGAALADGNRDRTRGLVLLYCGVIAALTLVSSGLNLFLNDRISGTGGLDGLGLRSALQTAQELLTYVNLVFEPFWSAGFLAAMIAMVRGREPEKYHLAEGFRRFGKILAYIAVQFLVAVALMVIAANLGATIFSLTPMGAQYAEVMGPVLSAPGLISAEGVVNWELMPMDIFLEATAPVILVILAIFALLYSCVSYCFRLTVYLIMTQPISAVRAYFLSTRLMRGHKWQMLKMDLSFWWYYLLRGAASVVAYLDVILSLLGIPVPIDPMVMFFGTLAAYCVLFTVLCLWKKCPVDASYVLAFEAIANPEPVETVE